MDDFKYIIRDIIVISTLAIIGFLLMGCATSRQTSGRTTRDSVVYIYKTIWRDSLRLHDSLAVRYDTRIRDSVVTRVDNATGQVVSSERYRWTDTSRDRDHTTSTHAATVSRDSATSATAHTDSTATTRKGRAEAQQTKPTHYGRTFIAGMVIGLLVAIAWRNRKKLMSVFIR